MTERDPDRRNSPRSETYFVAVEHEGDDIYYRVITCVSESGYRFESPSVDHRVGDEVEMDFPMPSGAPLRVSGEVARAIGRHVGVRVKQPEQFARLLLELKS
jgi:hypothetical protein